jgi:hypothetical protein
MADKQYMIGELSAFPYPVRKVKLQKWNQKPFSKFHERKLYVYICVCAHVCVSECSGTVS